MKSRRKIAFCLSVILLVICFATPSFAATKDIVRLPVNTELSAEMIAALQPNIQYITTEKIIDADGVLTVETIIETSEIASSGVIRAAAQTKGYTVKVNYTYNNYYCGYIQSSGSVKTNASGAWRFNVCNFSNYANSAIGVSFLTKGHSVNSGKTAVNMYGYYKHATLFYNKGKAVNCYVNSNGIVYY